MLIAFAFSFIGILLVYGNYKILRHNRVLVAFTIVALLLAILGIYLVFTSKLQEPLVVMPFFSPLVAILLLEIARMFFHSVRQQEIILYLGGLLPKRFEERFVSRLEKVITFLITGLALFLAYLIEKLLGLYQ